MGNGRYSSASYANYATTTGRTLNKKGEIDGDYSPQEMFTNRKLDPALNPYKVMRECCDSEEHPFTRPVILGLDVTGSMGDASVAIAKKLNPMMSKLFDIVPDIEFMTMAIGDLSYDKAPLQISQFESDIRIAEQLDKIYFEGNGGGNKFESYTQAWYIALYHTKMDCLNRGYKPLIITIGDEPMNPYLPHQRLNEITGDHNQADVETKELYKKIIKQFEVHHIACGNSYRYHATDIDKTWKALLGEHFHVADVTNITNMITNIILDYYKATPAETVITATTDGGIRW